MSLGPFILALALWRRLGLHRLLEEFLPEGREEVPWADVASVLVAGRFCCGQSSELGIADEWYGRTALDTLVGIDSGLTQEELATAIPTRKFVISRLENHASDAAVSTICKVAQALGKELVIELREPGRKTFARRRSNKHRASA